MVNKKKINTDLLFKIGVVVLLIILIGKFKGMQGGTNIIYVTNQSIIGLLESPNNLPGAFCELYTDMNTEFQGHDVTFTVSNGVGTECHVYGKYNNDQWGYVGKYITGNNGKVADKITLTTVGTLKLAAICGECTTDQAEVTVKQSQEQIVVPEQQQALTCAQKAQNNNAYYKEPILIAKDNTGNSCYGWGTMDCQDKGQEMSGYGLDGTCCLYTCELIQQQPQPEPQLVNGCLDSDSSMAFNEYIQNRGTCQDDTPQSIQDSCDGDMMREYSCNAELDGTFICGYTSMNCNALLPGTHCEGGRCVY